MFEVSGRLRFLIGGQAAFLRRGGETSGGGGRALGLPGFLSQSEGLSLHVEPVAKPRVALCFGCKVLEGCREGSTAEGKLVIEQLMLDVGVAPTCLRSGLLWTGVRLLSCRGLFAFRLDASPSFYP